MDFLKIHANVNYIPGDFNSQIHRVIRQKKFVPTFFFVDPFGYSLDYSTLESMMKVRSAEIFLNFMYNGLNRGISVESVEHTICNLFGCDEWKAIRDLSSTERENACIDLFKNRLKDIAAFVKEYKMSFPDKDRTYYYLIHLTNNAKGAGIMRYSFGKYNDGHLEYRGKKESQLSLFDTPSVKHEQIENILNKRYKGCSRKFINIVIDSFESSFYETDIRKTLLDMERDNKISVIRKPQYTKRNKPRICHGFHGKRSTPSHPKWSITRAAPTCPTIIAVVALHTPILGILKATKPIIRTLNTPPR
jgi:hypothetical protein